MKSDEGSSKKVNVELQVEPSEYFWKGYDSKGRFASYWHQVDETLTLDPKSVPEVGISNNLVSDYLTKRGINITSLETVACFEVLEHLFLKCFRPYGTQKKNNLL